MHYSPALLQERLKHVYWLGGSPCAGKSSIADYLAARYDLLLYRCDDAYYEHQKVVTPEQQPLFSRLAQATSEEIWIKRPVEQQTREELALYHEEFPLVVEDLLALPTDRPVLAEGAALLPECVAPLLCSKQQALWIVPTAAFQLHHYSIRDWTHEIIKDCSNPRLAFDNWMQRDIRFASLVAQAATERALSVLVVDGMHSLEENTAFVERHFRPGATI